MSNINELKELLNEGEQLLNIIEPNNGSVKNLTDSITFIHHILS